jgi:hypothetical protein
LDNYFWKLKNSSFFVCLDVERTHINQKMCLIRIDLGDAEWIFGALSLWSRWALSELIEIINFPSITIGQCVFTEYPLIQIINFPSITIGQWVFSEYGVFTVYSGYAPTKTVFSRYSPTKTVFSAVDTHLLKQYSVDTRLY